ncbi:MAG: TRAP transporter small permease [Desulfobacteraceae bacterium]|nr:MAG: TRAP transporter small permease [Desulfobacteraceae bacterium]
MGWTGVKKGIRRISYYACVLGMITLIPLMLLTFADVAMRSFIGKPIPGTFELSQYILAIFILLGAAYTQQVKGHVGVDFVTSRLSPSLQVCFKILTTLLSLFIIAIVVWQGWVEGIAEKAVSDQLRIPQSPFKVLVSIGGLLLWLELLIDLIDSFGTLGRRSEL